MNKIPPPIEIEALKASLVLAAVHIRNLEIWALSSPLADLKNPPPIGFDLALLPDDVRERVINYPSNAESSGGK